MTKSKNNKSPSSDVTQSLLCANAASQVSEATHEATSCFEVTKLIPEAGDVVVRAFDADPTADLIALMNILEVGHE